MIKRIVAIPGDTIKMSGFKVYIEPEGSNTYREEQELIPQTYMTIITGLPEGWTKEFPFSGELSPVTLEENQYFLLGDNRQESSDSRSWGPLPRDQLLGKVIYRYWPLSRSGKL
jgi:signal peptidase I